MFDEILEYDIYSKIDSLDTKYRNHSKIKEYKLYKKFYDLMSPNYILKVIQSNEEMIDPKYYENYIEMWYKE
jgi:hypothetical protein